MNRKPGDWNCRSCQHLNFSRRDSCQRCGEVRSIGSGGDRSDYTNFGGGRGGSSFRFAGSDVRPGDWYCHCSAHNFASRSSCFKCGELKEGTSVGDGNFNADFSRLRGRAGWKSGDWICNRSGCDEHNFANRMECFRCSAPRESGD